MVHQSNHGRSHRVEPEQRLAYNDGLDGDSEEKMGTKQSGNDWGVSLVRRRR